MRRTANILTVLALACLTLSFLQFSAIAHELEGQPFFTQADIQDAKIMLLFGLLSAAGSAIWGALQVFKARRGDVVQTIWSYVGSGFLLGTFGGYAIYQYILPKFGGSLSRLAIGGLVTLAISMCAVPFLQRIFALANDRIDKLK